MVRAVVVNYDGGPVTLRCVDALRATRYPRERLQIVVVDNASIDGVNWVLKEKYPDVVLIESDTNEGFARGCNLGMRDLDGVDYVALINNDAIVERDWLEPLLRGFTAANVGAVCPKLLLNLKARAVVLRPEHATVLPDGRTVGVRVDAIELNGESGPDRVRLDERFWPPRTDRGGVPGNWTKGVASLWWPVDGASAADKMTLTLAGYGPTTLDVGAPATVERVELDAEPRDVTVEAADEVHIVNSAGSALYSGWFGGDRGFLEPDVGQFDEAREVFAWCGGAVLLRAAYLREVGLFDPSYFLYYEDFDLAWRGRSTGWVYRYEPASRVLHEHAYSSKAGSAFFSFWVDRNRRLTLVKNAPARVAARAVVGSVLALARDLGLHVRAQVRRRRPPSPRVVKRRLIDFASFARAVPGAVRERRRIRSVRIVTHAEIAAWMVQK
jgi:GT2 family glycosyltransferase